MNQEQKPTVYLVDDNIEFCKLLVLVFAKIGVQFEYFTEVEDYFQALKKKMPTLSLIDLYFGAEDLGFEIIDRVRHEVSSSHPVVAISAKKDVATVNYALELGANDYVTKPIDRLYFLAKLEQYFKTQEIMDWSTSEVELPEEGEKAEVTLSVDITEVDEAGIRFLTPHLIAKGTSIQLESDFFMEILGQSVSPIMTVISTTPLELSNLYENYAELSSEHEEITRNIRSWINARTKGMAA